MNWGLKIALFYSSFVIFMLGMVFLASSQKFHLVTENYYEMELQHDAQRQAAYNSNALDEKLQIEYMLGQQKVALTFPEALPNISGTVHAYNRVNATFDQRFDITPQNDNAQIIDLSELPKGRWEIRVTWKSGEQTYFDTKDIYIS